MKPLALVLPVPNTGSLTSVKKEGPAPMYSTVFEEEDDLECETPEENPSDLVDFGLTVISDLGERIPSVQYIRPAKAETQDEFFAKLCRNGENDECFSTFLHVGEVEHLIGRSLRG